MLEAIIYNLINIGWAMLIFLCAYLSNVAFSLYYNIKILLQPFNRDKAINSALKVAAFLVGLSLLCVAITTLPLYANQIGWAIPQEYSDLFADLIILGAVLVVSCKYILEAFTKFKNICDHFRFGCQKHPLFMTFINHRNNFFFCNICLFFNRPKS